MPTLKAYPLPIKFDLLNPLTGVRQGGISFNNWWLKLNDYGGGHVYVYHREEVDTRYHPDPSALHGLWHMVMTADPQKPFTKLQQTLLLSAFPNSAKKLILSMKCAGDMIAWATEKPDEMLAAMEVVIPKMNASVREYRANQHLRTPDQVKAWVVDGILPPEFQKLKDAETKRRAELITPGGSTVAPETKPVPSPAPTVADVVAGAAVYAAPNLIDSLNAAMRGTYDTARIPSLNVIAS